MLEHRICTLRRDASRNSVGEDHRNIASGFGFGWCTRPGKTLVGLNLATRREEVMNRRMLFFLSGKDRFVAVLREALTRDEVERRKTGEKVRKGKVGESVKHSSKTFTISAMMR